MKKILALIMVSALVLTGCSGGKNGQTDKNTASQPPQLSAQFGTGEVDIADYKIFWNGEEQESKFEDSAFSSYESFTAQAGDEFSFKFSDNPPKDVSVTEYIVSGEDIAVKDDSAIITNVLDCEYSDSEIIFSITGINSTGARYEERIYSIMCSWGDGDKADTVNYVFAAEVKDETTEPVLPSRNAAEPNEYDGVTMSISADSVTPTGVVADIVNSTDDTAVFGTKYRIDVKEDGEWYKVDYLPSVISVNWEDVAYEVSDTFKIPINWENYYGELEPGEYRLVKEFFFVQESSVDYEAAAEFTVE